MPRTVFLALLLTLTVLVVSVSPQGRGDDDEIAVTVSLNRDKIGLDESAIMEVTVSGPAQNLPSPDIPTLSAFEIYSQGRASNISIVDGQVEASVTYRYMLVPQKTGTFPLDRIGVVYKNRRYNGNSVELTVIGAGAAPDALSDQMEDARGDSRDYLLQASVDNENPYVGQQVTLTLRFLVAVRYYGSPELAEPKTTGFWTEVIGNKTPYYQTINNRRYKVIERKYALFPTQAGELTIGRAAITATVPDQSARRRDPFGSFGNLFGRGRDVTVRSNPIKITARSLPSANRPESFTGSIGHYQMRVTADKQEVQVNEAVTVTVRIHGTGNIKSVAEPVIPESDEFRVYRSSSNEKAVVQSDRLGGTKTFEEVFIPRRPGTLEIPALTFTHFDPEAGVFKTERSRPIRLKVLRPEGYVADAEVPYRAPSMTIGSDARDIRHIKNQPGDMQPSGWMILRSPVYLAVNGIPVILVAGLIVWQRRKRRIEGDTGLARSRAASRMARKRLAHARSLARVEQAEAFFTEVSQALTEYLADKLNISPHGLTEERIATSLSEKGADDELIDNALDLLERCNFARFAPSSVTEDDIARTLSQAEQVMVRMEGVRFA